MGCCQVWVLVGAAAALTVSLALREPSPPPGLYRTQGDDDPPVPSALYDTPVATPPVPSGLYGTPVAPPPVPPGLYDTPVAPPVPSGLYETPSETRPAASALLQTPSDPSDVFETPAAPSDVFETPAAPSDMFETPAAPSDVFETPAAPSDVFETLSAPSEQDETPSASDPRLQEAAQNLRPDVTRPMEGMPYDFQFGVDDPDTGNSYSHVENSDGRTTQGEYRVLLPDGRTQVVTFFDSGEGFTARVTYQQ